MSANAGPDIVEDGIVFYYDTGNTVKSYIGEPTTNICNNPEFLTSITGTAGGSFGGWTFGSWDSSNTHETVDETYNGQSIKALKITLGSYPAHFFSSNWGTETIPGRTYTWTNLMKGTPGQVVQMYSHWGNLLTVTLTGEWQEYSTTFARGGSLGLYMYYNPSHTNAGNVIYVARVQVEEKTHKTPFVNGTRSVTQGLLDMARTSTINITNASFDNNAQIEFDGTNDYTDSGYDLSWNNTNSVSVEFMVKPYTVSGGNYGIIGKEYPNWEWAFYQSSTTLNLVYWNNAGGHSNGMDFQVNVFPTANIWYHVIYTWDTTTSIFYVNGTTAGSKVAVDPSINQNRSNNVMIGGHTYVWSDSYFNGKLDLVKFYNKALTASEVLTNYNALKTRFGI